MNNTKELSDKIATAVNGLMPTDERHAVVVIEGNNIKIYGSYLVWSGYEDVELEPIDITLPEAIGQLKKNKSKLLSEIEDLYKEAQRELLRKNDLINKINALKESL